MKRITILPLVLLALAAPRPCGALAQEAAASAQVHPDWLRIVPGDARFYVELNDLQGIRRRFQRLGIWPTVRELTVRDGPPTTQPWRRRAEQLLGMSPETAISEVLGRRSALIATSPARWRNGVILAELGTASRVRRLLRRWQARRLHAQGPVRRYLLRGDLLLAVQERLLVLGPANDPEGLWGRTVSLLSGKQAPHLRGRSEFAALRTRLHGEFSGLAYASWAPNDPYAIAGCQRLLVGFSVTDRGLQCQFHGQRQGSTELLTPWKAGLVSALPADTLAVWSGSFRPEVLRHPPAGTVLDDQGSLIGLFVGLLSSLERQSGKILDTLGPRVMLVVGPDATAAADDFHLPGLTVACQARDVESHLEKLDMLVGFFARFIEAMATQNRSKPLGVRVQTRRVEDVDIHFVGIGSVLAERLSLSFLDRVTVCWAGLDDSILFSSSTAHLENIIRAAHGKVRRLADVSAGSTVLPDLHRGEPTVQWTMIRGGAIAKLFAGWLEYLDEHHPDTLNDQWWQTWAAARLRRRTRLGVALKDDPGNPHRAVVQEIDSGSPAVGQLQVGDVILTASGRLLAGPHPAREVARRYEQRGGAKVFKVGILRDGKRLALAIPVPPVPQADLRDLQPIRALKQLIILLRRVETVRIARYGTDPNRFDVDAQVVWAPAH